MTEPRTAAGRHTLAAFPSADPTYVHAILAIETEARAAALDDIKRLTQEARDEARDEGYAAALDEARAAVDGIEPWSIPTGDYIDKDAVLAAIDALREVADKV